MESGFNDSRGDIHLLLNILIKCPIYSFSRLQKVTESSNFKQLLSLANYYADSDPASSDESKQQRRVNFFYQILLQQDFPRKSISNVIKELKGFFEEKQNFLNGLAINDLPLNDWASSLIKKGKNFKEACKLSQDFSTIMNTDGWNNKSGDEKITIFNNVFYYYLKNCGDTPVLDDDSQIQHIPEQITTEWLTKIFNENRINVKVRDDMIKALKNDIKNLRMFISESIIPALNTDVGFTSFLIRGVDGIRSAINNKKGKLALENWIAQNIPKIRADDFKRIEENKLKNEKLKDITKKIEKALKDLVSYHTQEEL